MGQLTELSTFKSEVERAPGPNL
ncbi:uncharacterized protein G2W53_010538 [Senna tora]|uniref:Uncharacterized protein n=1 Tax=Senna tora TaxID=362788 RepID=A0A835C9U4_9FABA|nr:uncharacterized protein G2W53_010538 [Senna tora]